MQRKERGASRRLGYIQILPCTHNTAETQTLGLWRHIYLQLISDPEGPLFPWLDPSRSILASAQSFTDFSGWADPSTGFKSLWMSKFRQSSIQGPSSILGVLFPYLGTLSKTKSQPALQATLHKWWNPLQTGGTTHRLTGLIPSDPPELWRAGLAAYNPHRISLFCTKSKTAFRTVCAKDKGSRSFKTGFSFLVHTCYLTHSFYFWSPSVLASVSGH